HPLAQQLAAPGARHRAQMDVGNMGEFEHGEGCACLILSPDTKGPRLPCKCAYSGVRSLIVGPCRWNAKGVPRRNNSSASDPKRASHQGVAVKHPFAVDVISDLAGRARARAWPRRWCIENDQRGS